MKLVLLALVVLVGAGCRNASLMSTEVRDDGKGNTVHIVGDGHSTEVTTSDGGHGRFVPDKRGGGTYTATDAEGNTSIHSTNLDLEPTDIGIALYPNSQKSPTSLDSRTTRGSKTSGSLTRIVDASVEEVVKFYEGQLEVESNSEFGKGRIVIGARGNRRFTIVVQKKDGSTDCSLNYEDR